MSLLAEYTSAEEEGGVFTYLKPQHLLLVRHTTLPTCFIEVVEKIGLALAKITWEELSQNSGNKILNLGGGEFGIEGPIVKSSFSRCVK